MIGRWLVKSEPDCWSWDDQVRAGIEPWSGVRNHQAAGYLRAMRRGDTAFFYHSVSEKRVVGIVRVVREAYLDPTDPAGRWVAVDFETFEPLPRPVSLAEIKADPRLETLALIRQSRLSVMPLDEASWQVIRMLSSTASPT